ncbi:MAG: pyridoxal-phosphate dependent enzyme [Flavobacteriales bacterium]|nr:pyridoxal-phosphate dependent enzyme [Flavobacteriales bacterium]MDG2246883.1 pyridoxal-phosphate dependent enzyme [Flavobacteriales bacterium]
MSKRVFNNVLESIGDTPMIRLNEIAKDLPGTIYAKVEYFNPGNSVKDRMALKMLEDAEKSGAIKPGGTVIECTSGNTGMGLALACVVKGYKLICTSNDKQSKEKFDVLRALGAQVIVCPTNVAPDHPDSYYSVAEKLQKETPNSIWCNQYDNLSNRQAHYESTGPEIWEQTEGKITHFVVGVGTGGTISGVGKYLKEKNPDIKIWGADTYGSVFKKYHETGEFDEKEIYPYITEGIGEDILPKNVDFSVIDHFEKVTDKDGAVVTREIALKEGLFLGYSAGSAFQVLRQMKHTLKEDDVVVVLFHDHGSRYVGKVYNDDWMKDRGFLKDEVKTAADLVKEHRNLPLLQMYSGELVSAAVQKMRQFNISQMPVVHNGEFVGSIDDRTLFEKVVDDSNALNASVSDYMGSAYPIVNESDTIEHISKLVSKDVAAVMVKLNDGGYHIITRHDLISAMA